MVNGAAFIQFALKENRLYGIKSKGLLKQETYFNSFITQHMIHNLKCVF